MASVPTQHLARIGVVQFDPKLGQIEKNITEARKLTEDLRPGSLDLLCFPEMAFTGYRYSDLETIYPFLEEPTTGPTFTFCSALAKHLRCYIAVGYPERIRRVSHTSLAANAALVISPEGDVIKTYRKTNLFEMDVPWAQAGNGFALIDLPAPLGRTALGICMDLNPMSPPPFTPTTIPYEFAEFVLQNSCRTLVLLCNWLDPGTKPHIEWSIDTVNYWAERLFPLWDDTTANGEDDNVLVIICNRAGVELGTTFAGTSLVMNLSRSSGEPKVLGVMKRTETGVRVWNIER